MPDRLDNLKVICRGGLFSNDHHLELSEDLPGSATALVNFEPGLFGGYRRMDGYAKLNPDYDEVGGALAEGKVLGICIFRDTATGTSVIIAARKDASVNTYSFWRYVPNAAWVKYTLTSPITRPVTAGGLTVNKVRFAQADFGAGNILYVVDGVNPLLQFDGVTWTESANNVITAPNALVAPSLVAVFEDHIFVSGDPGKPALVAHSAPQDGTDWTTANGAGQIPTGFDVVDFKGFREDLFVFGPNTIKKISVDPSAAFVIKPVTQNIGCIARDSVVEIGGDLLFLAPDGFRPVAGTARIGDVELETVSRQIQNRVIGLRENFDLTTFNSVVIRGKSQVRFFVGDDTVAADSSYGIIGGIRLSQEGGSGIRWEWGDIIGIRASCCTSDYVGSEEMILHGDYDGIVYVQEQTNTFNGAPIAALYLTPFLDLGDTELRKNFQKLHVFLRPEGPVELNIGVSYDWNDQNVRSPLDYARSLSAGVSTFGNPLSVYGGTGVVYGGSDKPVIQVEQQGTGRSVRYAFVSVNEGAPFSIQGFIIQIAQAGKN